MIKKWIKNQLVAERLILPSKEKTLDENQNVLVIKSDNANMSNIK